jgi:hypothetical protein
LILITVSHSLSETRKLALRRRDAGPRATALRRQSHRPRPGRGQLHAALPGHHPPARGGRAARTGAAELLLRARRLPPAPRARRTIKVCRTRVSAVIHSSRSHMCTRPARPGTRGPPMGAQYPLLSGLVLRTRPDGICVEYPRYLRSASSLKILAPRPLLIHLRADQVCRSVSDLSPY